MMRKDYIRIAACFAEARAAVCDDLFETATLNTAVEIIARMFARDNSAFDRRRFLAACGLTGEN